VGPPRAPAGAPALVEARDANRAERDERALPVEVNPEVARRALLTGCSGTSPLSHV
jgi:hypothetical protein